MGRSNTPQTIAELRLWLGRAPEGTTLPAATVAALLDGCEDGPEPTSPPSAESVEAAPETWRVKVWTVPADVRIGKHELLEAVGRSESWLYRHTSAKADHRIPHRKLDGELVFVVGEVRAWLKEHEDIIEAGPMAGPGARLRAV